jgi:hypothetical protein
VSDETNADWANAGESIVLRSLRSTIDFADEVQVDIIVVAGGGLDSVLAQFFCCCFFGQNGLNFLEKALPFVFGPHFTERVFAKDFCYCERPYCIQFT